MQARLITLFLGAIDQENHWVKQGETQEKTLTLNSLFMYFMFFPSSPFLFQFVVVHWLSILFVILFIALFFHVFFPFPFPFLPLPLCSCPFHVFSVSFLLFFAHFLKIKIYIQSGTTRLPFWGGLGGVLAEQEPVGNFLRNLAFGRSERSERKERTWVFRMAMESTARIKRLFCFFQEGQLKSSGKKIMKRHQMQLSKYH